MAEGGKIDETKGRAKKAAGELSGDRELQREGEKDKTAGKAKEKTDEAIDKAKRALSDDR